MPYVERDAVGAVSGIFAARQFEGQEFLDETHTDISTFRAAIQKNEADAETKARLANIDIASIRSIREYIATLADAPQRLRDHEAAAAVERGKLR